SPNASRPTPGGPAVSSLTTTATVTVTIASSSIRSIGHGTQATAVARNSNGTVLSGGSATWSSSDPSVATILTNGVAVSQGYGATTLKAVLNGIEGTVLFSVLRPGDPAVVSI